MTPDELLDAARDLIQRPGASLDGIWPAAERVQDWLARSITAYTHVDPSKYWALVGVARYDGPPSPSAAAD